MLVYPQDNADRRRPLAKTDVFLHAFNTLNSLAEKSARMCQEAKMSVICLFMAAR